ncbi:MAG: hypothetical protein ACREQ1_08015, partial [Woeseiaceae bacterium]
YNTHANSPFGLSGAVFTAARDSPEIRLGKTLRKNDEQKISGARCPCSFDVRRDRRVSDA